ncbi:outer membrane biogenesis protein BamB [Planctomycetes bacterium CA13]|uniref:Outer membrane biogenesis protein BamB n=1 Tax=Novipirellula herctigrandis TaxID=2527986 RepID=A0A5C5YWS6_9BACT|nr:outer membrane biogenesis protein BamB [Planctomycetes bacterium CA13]
MFYRILFACGFVFTVASPTFSAPPSGEPLQALTWNQWRGPNRDGQISTLRWPDKFEGHLELVWQQPHGPSYSGPVVMDGLVYTTETIAKKTERVTAHSLADGTIVWEKEWDGAMAVPFFAASNGDWIRSTPIVVPDHLVVFGMRDVLVCLDPKTGAEKWRVDFPKVMGTPLQSFGAVCSPLIDDDAIYVQTGGALVKLALTSGKVIWKTLQVEGGMSGGAFSSPTLGVLGGVKQLVVQTREQLCGVSLDDGAVLWNEPIEAFRGMNILTPLLVGDAIFTAAHSGKSQLFNVIRSENGQWNVAEAWSQKTQGYMSSPVLIGDAIYLHLKNQRLAALSVADGKIRWTSSPFGKYWSMIAAGNKILCLDQTGDLRLIAADNSELKVLDQIRVGSDTWAHLAVETELLIIRDLAALKVYRWK